MGISGSLRGITWNHSRGYTPMVASGQSFEDLNPGAEIMWQKRSLKDFGDAPLDELAERFDLLVIDHPYVGYVAAHKIFEPLEKHLPAELLNGLARSSVGRSYESYWFDNRLWALPIDAAAPVSCWRPDLIEQAGIGVPQTWDEVLELAARGLVTVPATPVDSLMHFFMFCCGLGEEPFSARDRVVSLEIGTAALEDLRKLILLSAPECLERNPIETYREMVTGDQFLYCPFAFGYSNYARSGFAPRELRFGELVTIAGKELRSTLGGAGLAISKRCAQLDLAVAYLEFVTSGPCQRGLYFDSGGQPAHRSAWEDEHVNAAANNFFKGTLSTLDEAYLRPRYNGYTRFQEEAGALVQAYLRRGGDGEEVLTRMEEARAAGNASGML